MWALAHLTGVCSRPGLPATSECLCPGGGCCQATPASRADRDTMYPQAPTVTVEGFLPRPILAVEKQFEERKKLSLCT